LIAGGLILPPNASGRKRLPREAFCSTWERIWPTRRWCSSASRKRSPPRFYASANGLAPATLSPSACAIRASLVVLGANCLSTPSRPRFHLRGAKGNYWKSGLDPQEAALNKVTRIDDPEWGKEPAAEWGNLIVDVNGNTVTRSVEPIPGDYRLYYAGVRDALLGKPSAPVPVVAAWRVARLLEWAAESSDKRREIICDWSEEPK
jgi:hypothetical protein